MSEKVDWYLHRKNCASCAKSESWLAEHSIEAVEIVDARKHRFDESQALQLLEGSNKVYVARGKSWAAYDPSDDDQAMEIRKKMMGPHGTLRAPALRFGEVFVVGYNAEMYAAARQD